MQAGITTVAFDFGGVLSLPIEELYLCHMASVLGAGKEQFITALWKFRHRFDSGEIPAADYWQLVSNAVNGKLSSQSSQQAAETIRLLTELDAAGWSSLNPAMIRWALTLKQAGYRLLIISNMSPEAYDLIIRNSFLPDYVERVVLSGWLHINKPDQEIFLEAARQMHIEPGEMLFIDDLMHNVEGSRAAGLQALQFSGADTLAGELEECFPALPRMGLTC